MPDYTYTHSQRSALPPPTLDLHGRGADDAVSDVTLFLDRYRRTVDSSPYKVGEKGGSSNRLFVKIITGSGSVRSITGNFILLFMRFLISSQIQHYYSIALMDQYYAL